MLVETEKKSPLSVKRGGRRRKSSRKEAHSPNGRTGLGRPRPYCKQLLQTASCQQLLQTATAHSTSSSAPEEDSTTEQYPHKIIADMIITVSTENENITFKFLLNKKLVETEKKAPRSVNRAGRTCRRRKSSRKEPHSPNGRT